MTDAYAANVISNLRFENTINRARDDVLSVLGSNWGVPSTPTYETSTPITGTASMAVDGTSGKQSNRASAPFGFTALEDFTVECRVKMSVTQSAGGSGAEIIGNFANSAGWSLAINSTGTARWNGKTLTVTGSTTLAVGTAYYLAYSRKAGTGYLFVNGVVVGTSADTEDLSTQSTTLWLGRGGSSGTIGFKGLIDEVRVTKGIGRYDTTYTPAAIEDLSPTGLIRDDANDPNRMHRYLTQFQQGSYADAIAYNGVIAGLVDIEGTYVSRMVRLYNKTTGQLVNSQWSASNGSYQFNNLDPSYEYFVIAHDYERIFNSPAQDFIQP